MNPFKIILVLQSGGKKGCTEFDKKVTVALSVYKRAHGSTCYCLDETAMGK